MYYGNNGRILTPKVKYIRCALTKGPNIDLPMEWPCYFILISASQGILFLKKSK